MSPMTLVVHITDHTGQLLACYVKMQLCQCLD